MSEAARRLIENLAAKCCPKIELRYERCVDLNKPFVLYDCTITEEVTGGDLDEVTVTLKYSEMAQLPKVADDNERHHSG